MESPNKREKKPQLEVSHHQMKPPLPEMGYI